MRPDDCYFITKDKVGVHDPPGNDPTCSAWIPSSSNFT